MANMLLLLGTATQGSALACATDAFITWHALHALLAACTREDTLAVLSQSSSEEMAMLVARTSDDTCLMTLCHEADAKTFVQDRHVEAVFVLGGDEHMLHTAERMIGYAPEARSIPLASTGGAAQVLFERTPSAFDPDYRERFPGLSLMTEILDGLRTAPAASLG